MKMGAARYGPSMANRRAVLWAVFGWGLLWAGAAARTTTGGHQIPESAVKTKEEFMSFTSFNEWLDRYLSAQQRSPLVRSILISPRDDN